jgi:uncharacterized protein
MTKTKINISASLSVQIRMIGLICVLFLFTLAGCKKSFTPEEKEYIAKIEKERGEKNDWMKNNSNSPFNRKGKVEFHNLKYFDVDPEFKFSSKLYENEKKDTIIIYGTKGEPRNVVKYGYVLIGFEKAPVKINVYEGSIPNGIKYYSIWFTDETTNKESYGVGRYLDFELVNDSNHIYNIDFNEAYNPYCSYSSNYSCAIPTREDYIPVAIEAGEKKFHD